VTAKKFYDWQTAGGTNDVMHLVDCLERAEVRWCAIDGIAVNHWAEEPMVTRDVDFVVAAEDVDRAVSTLVGEGFTFDHFQWSVNFKGQSSVSIQLSTEDIYLSFPDRSVPADVHGILLRVASLEETLTGKVLAWRDSSRRQSKRIKDFADIARLVETHPTLWSLLPENLQLEIEKPAEPC